MEESSNIHSQDQRDYSSVLLLKNSNPDLLIYRKKIDNIEYESKIIENPEEKLKLEKIFRAYVGNSGYCTNGTRSSEFFLYLNIIGNVTKKGIIAYASARKPSIGQSQGFANLRSANLNEKNVILEHLSLIKQALFEQ